MNRELQAALEDGFNTSLLLKGTRGQPMMKDAKEAASFLLGTDENALSSHPDFMLVCREEDEKTIGVDISDQIIARSLEMPAVASRIVVVIDEINTMTIQAQNKLLKLLEESNAVVIIGVAYEDTLLPTVKSRMRSFSYHPLSFQAFSEAFKKSGVTGEDLLVRYHVSGGILNIIPDQEAEDIFLKVKNALSLGRAPLLFKIFGMVGEKEKGFFQTFRSYVPAVLSFMGAVISGLHEYDHFNNRYRDCCLLLLRHREICTDIAYTKDSFFSCVAQVVELLGRKE